MTLLDKLDRKYAKVGGSAPFVEIYHSGTPYEDKQDAIKAHYMVSRYTAKNWLSDMRRIKEAIK